MVSSKLQVQRSPCLLLGPWRSGSLLRRNLAIEVTTGPSLTPWVSHDDRCCFRVQVDHYPNTPCMPYLPVSWGGFRGQCRQICHTWSVCACKSGNMQIPISTNTYKYRLAQQVHVAHSLPFDCHLILRKITFGSAAVLQTSRPPKSYTPLAGQGSGVFAP